MNEFIPWLVFFTSACVVVAAGTQLARYGDRIASETGIGGLWIGVVLIATATSLPEVVTAATAAWIEDPDLAAGNLFGSNMANMLVLAVVDLLHRQRNIWQAVSLGHTLVAALAIVLTALAGLFAIAGPGWALGHVGLDTISIAVLYVLGARVVFRQQYLETVQDHARTSAASILDEVDAFKPRVRSPSRRSVISIAISAAFILAAGPLLTDSASRISEITGISSSFVGVTFLAISTSLPEMATAMAAAQLQAYDLAVADLFGSNAFNMSLLLAVDIAYRPGPLLADVAIVQVLAALVAILLMAVGVMGIVYRAEKRFLVIEPDAAMMVLGYIGGLWLVYHASS